MLSQDLPPLDSLVAFEAAARLGSFTLTARELNLTQAAISQRIRNLERALGTTLFERAHRSVLLNEAGRKYQHSVSMVLGHLGSATKNLTRLPHSEQLTVAVDQAIAHLWLFPRFYRFCELHEDVSIRLVVSDELDKCLGNEVDVALVFGGEGTGGYKVERLFDEEVFPVCSPTYTDRLVQPFGLDGLSQCDLIELEDERWDWMNWEIWMTRAYGGSAFEGCRVQIGSYPLVVQAACNGLGVALGWKGLVDAQLADGTLVKPTSMSVLTDGGYNLLSNQQSSSKSVRDLFIDWVLSQLT